MTEREQLEQAITALESQRLVLGDAVVDAALAPMREKLATLHEHESTAGAVDRGATGERKLVTVMFADISGFTSLSETMDPESVRDLMNQCFAHIIPAISRYDGTIDKFIGDEIMALFGAPRAHENDAERAVRAALEMTSLLDEFNDQHKTDLGLHFGINTGLMLAGRIGAGSRREYSVMGGSVNLASRLVDVAERGQIFVGPDTYRMTAPLFEFETLEPITVKGKVDPVPAYRAVGLKTKPDRVRGLELKGISSALVGREKERALIQASLDILLNGQGGIVGVIGEAGLGKSRLVAEVRPLPPPDPRNDKKSLDILWLQGDTFSFGQTISYWPFQQILRGWAGITEEDDANTIWFKLENHVRKLVAEETIDYLPYLASLLALEVRGEYGERLKFLDGEALGKQIFRTSRRFFERLAHSQRTVLVFEDLHWMDESSTHLLEHLLPLVETAPLLIIGLTRPEWDTPAAHWREISMRDHARHYTEVRLAPLSVVDSTQLVRNLLEIEDLPASVRDLVVR